MHSNNHILVYNPGPTCFGALGAPSSGNSSNPDEIVVLCHESGNEVKAVFGDRLCSRMLSVERFFIGDRLCSRMLSVERSFIGDCLCTQTVSKYYFHLISALMTQFNNFIRIPLSSLRMALIMHRNM